MTGRRWRVFALLLLMAAVASAIVDDNLDNDLGHVTMPRAAEAIPPHVVLGWAAPADDDLVTRDVHDAFHPPRLG